MFHGHIVLNYETLSVYNILLTSIFSHLFIYFFYGLYDDFNYIFHCLTHIWVAFDSFEVLLLLNKILKSLVLINVEIF